MSARIRIRYSQCLFAKDMTMPNRNIGVMVKDNDRTEKGSGESEREEGAIK